VSSAALRYARSHVRAHTEGETRSYKYKSLCKASSFSTIKVTTMGKCVGTREGEGEGNKKKRKNEEQNSQERICA
jgi:hypothetical protein